MATTSTTIAAAEPIAGRQGHYAGAVSRLVAFGADVGASWGLFTLGVAALAFTIQLVTGSKFSLTSHQIASLIAAVIWEFIYFSYQWALSGKTLGMAVLGIRVVRSDGSPVGARQAVLRTLTLPLSFLLFGLGFLGCGGWPSRMPRPAPDRAGRVLGMPTCH
jgi:uncharacterized RDD family membrane protein YckC